KYNLDLPSSAQGSGKKLGLYSVPTLESITATVRRQFGPALQVFVDASASNTIRDIALSSGIPSTFTLAANAPNNPFGQAVVVSVPSASADIVQSTQVHDRRLVGGFLFKLSDSWQAEADFTWDRSKFAYGGSRLFLATGTTAVANGTLDV